MAITHSTVATAADEAGAEVNKTEWNDDHVIDDSTLSIAKTTGLQTAIDAKETVVNVALKSPIASPTFTGTVVLPNVPAIVTTQLNTKQATITDGDLTIARTNGLQTALDAKATVTALNTRPEALIVAASDNETALATGTVFTFYMPYAMTLTDIKASVLTAPTDATLIVDVHDSGTTIMSTNKLDIETAEFHTSTAATQPALTDTALANNAKIEIIIDQVGSTVAGAGLVIYLIGYQA
tara:strand:- start:203 stop:919 length:717 start_codon:yes stop_codon:yes gene_type:complete